MCLDKTLRVLLIQPRQVQAGVGLRAWFRAEVVYPSKDLKMFIRLVIQILKQYSITQPGVVPKLVATFRSPTASFIRLVVT